MRKLLVGTHSVYGHINERLQDDVNHLAKVYCKSDKMARIDEGVRFSAKSQMTSEAPTIECREPSHAGLGKGGAQVCYTCLAEGDKEEVF